MTKAELIKTLLEHDTYADEDIVEVNIAADADSVFVYQKKNKILIEGWKGHKELATCKPETGTMI